MSAAHIRSLTALHHGQKIMVCTDDVLFHARRTDAKSLSGEKKTLLEMFDEI